MITAAYTQSMARYNRWQNKQLSRVIDAMDQEALDLDRGAFFGSMQRTLSHLLWGDTLWMSRFDAGTRAPDCTAAQGVTRWADKAAWVSDRFRLDRRICIWADRLRQMDLSGNLTWTYSYENKETSRPLGFAITHFFNHQTHHRGQLHAMLTAAGQAAPVSDLSYLPEDA